MNTRAAVVAIADTAPDQGDARELDRLAREIVADLHAPSAATFWLDMLGSAAVAWTGFVLALTLPPLSAGMVVSVVVSAFAFYRGLSFTHELTHLRKRELLGFETAWNIVLGAPMLLPSFTYIGVHQSHHNLSTYGTKDDPEYLPFARSRGLILAFSFQSSLLLPVLLLLRFLVIAPVGLLWPAFHRWLEVHASSFSMNPHYRRSVPQAVATKMRRWELAMLVMWGALLAASGSLRNAAYILAVWYAVVAIVSFVNTLRVLGAHGYDSDGAPLDRHGQLLDSIDTPGGPWTELWAPVGLRYHALHHYFPGIPYHNLGKAYQRLMSGIPQDAVYRDATSASLPHSLITLYDKARHRTLPPTP